MNTFLKKYYFALIPDTYTLCTFSFGTTYVDEQFPTLIFPKSDFVRLGAGETGLLAEGAAQPAAVEQLRYDLPRAELDQSFKVRNQNLF